MLALDKMMCQPQGWYMVWLQRLINIVCNHVSILTIRYTLLNIAHHIRPTSCVLSCGTFYASTSGIISGLLSGGTFKKYFRRNLKSSIML